MLSHIAKCLEIGIPSQSHIFPVIEGTYRGCVVSGYHFSVALRESIYRPSDLAKEDLGSFGSNVEIIGRIMDVTGVKSDDRQDFETEALKGMRRLDSEVKAYTFDLDETVKIRDLAAQLRFNTEFWKINVENLQRALKMIFEEDKEIDLDLPMDSSGLYRSTRLESVLSLFGPTVPSPQIPNGALIDVTTGREPDNFVRPLVFRHADLDSAFVEWMEVGKSGKVKNGPNNLSTRFQHIPVRGDKERKGFFELFRDWHFHIKSKFTGQDVADELGAEGLLAAGDSIKFGGVVLDDTF